MKSRDKYLKLVEWSEEDKCYIGTCPELFEGGVNGPDEQKVYKELCQTVDEWIAIYKKDKITLPESVLKKEYSGSFVLRLGKELHKVIAIRALQAGESLNNYCKKALGPNYLKHVN
jgi:predicted HicB family RNase H-like nuclease